jgi:hypothetical protein
MSAACRFCGAEFSNAQAVRAHLKGCGAYQNRPPRQTPDAAPRQASLGEDSLGALSLGSDRPASGIAPESAFDPVRRLEKEIAAQRLRLQLREVEEAHREMDRRAEATERARQQAEQQEAEAKRDAEREREAARRRAENQSAEQARRQAEDSRRRAERRTIIQDIKNTSMHRWPMSSADRRAQALQDIENALSGLPVDELPEAELIQIADGICSKAQQTERQATQRDFQAALHDLGRVGRRSQLMQHGQDFAARELRGVEGLSAFDQAQIVQRVANALEDVTGDETRDAIESRVEAILEREGLGWEDDEEDEDGDDDDET